MYLSLCVFTSNSLFELLSCEVVLCYRLGAESRSTNSARFDSGLETSNLDPDNFHMAISHII